MAEIPWQMREQPYRWNVWRTDVRNGKGTKVPYATNGYGADATNPDAWTTYEKALAYLESHPTYDGLAFRLGEGWSGVDLDGCRDPETGSVHPWAEEIVERLDTYTEVSPSRTGLKVFLVAEATGIMTHGRNTSDCPITKIELYTGRRYFTVTGESINSPGPLNEFTERTPQLLSLWEELFPYVPPPRVDRHVPEVLYGTDAEKLAYLLRHPRRAALWNGDTSAYGGDESRADIALCNDLRYFLHTAEEVDKWFRMSGLMRPKWDEMHGSQTYGQMTIGKAMLGETRKGRRFGGYEV